MTFRRLIPLLATVFCAASLAVPAIASASHIQGGSINARITSLGHIQGTVTYLTTGSCTVGGTATEMPSITVENPSNAQQSVTAPATFTRCLPGSKTATGSYDLDLMSAFGSAADGAYTVTASACCRVSGITNVAMGNDSTSFAARVTKSGMGTASSSPVLNSGVASNVSKGYAYKQNLNGVDPDGGTVTHTSRAGQPNAPNSDVVSISSGGLVSMTAPQTNSYANGTYFSYLVRATDSQGDYSERDVLLRVTNTNAPPSINGLTGSPYTATAGAVAQNVSFTADDPNNANPKIDTVSLGLAAGAPAWATLSAPAGNPANATLTLNPPQSVPEGDYTFNIDGVDSDGTYPLFASEAVTVHVVNTPPNTTLGTTPPALSGSTAPTFTFGSDDNAATFECKLDGGAWSACASPKTVTGLSDGSHTFQIRAVDAAGQIDSTPQSYTWTVDATAPAAPAIDQAPSAVAQASTFAFGTGAGETAECRVDDGDWAACASPFAPIGLADGAHTFAVRLVDAAGNRSAATTAAWTLDTTAPIAPKFTSGPTGSTSSKSATFDWTSEPGASFECRTDGGAWGACVNPYALTGLSAGKHTFAVRQTDLAGNVGVAGIAEWTVGTEDQAPTATPTGTPTAVSPVLGQDASVAVKGDAATVGCRVNGGKLASCVVDVYARVTGADGDFALARTTRAADGKLVKIGTGRVVSKDGAARLSVDIVLNATGRKLMADKLAGVDVVLKIEAKTVEGPKLNSRKVAKLVPAHQLIVPTEGLFASGKFKVRAKPAHLLAKIAGHLRKVKAVRCVGHTDSVGSTTANDKLGRERARAVCAALRAHGVKASMSTDSGGERHPRATNATARGRALNRRVEISVRYR